MPPRSSHWHRTRPDSQAGWCWLIAAFLIVLASESARATDPAKPLGAGVLDVPGGFLAGHLLDAQPIAGQSRQTLFWQSPMFDMPLEFQVNEIVRVRFPAVPTPPPAPGAYRFELRGDDALIGGLESIDEEFVTVAVGGPAGPQRVRIKRAWLQRITRLNSTASNATAVPGGLNGWDESKRGAWREDSGHLVCDRPGSSLFRDIKAPAKACYEIVVSWKQSPSFELVFATDRSQVIARSRSVKPDPKKASPSESYLLWFADGKLTALREANNLAKLGQIENFRAESGRLRLQVFVDQERGRLAVVLPQSIPVPAIDLTLPPQATERAAPQRGGWQIVLNNGDVRLESLRVRPWDGGDPRINTSPHIALSSPATPRANGGTESKEIAGIVTAFAPETRAFVIQDGETSRSLPEANVSEIVFPQDAPPVEPSKDVPPDRPAPSLLAVLAGNQRASGHLLKVKDGNVWLECEAFADPMACPISQLVALEAIRGNRVSDIATTSPSAGRLGRLEADGLLAPGWLEATQPVAGQRCLSWHPRGCVNASAFSSGPLSAKIVYRVIDVSKLKERRLGGIGAGIWRNNDRWMINMILHDGAAQQDGRLQGGEEILGVGQGEHGALIKTQTLQLEEVQDLLRGLPGTTVRLLVASEKLAANKKSIEVTLVRRELDDYQDVGGAMAMLDQAIKTQQRLAPADIVMPAHVAAEQAQCYLRNGDQFSCTVLAADGKGLRIKGDIIDAEGTATFLLTECVQAVELLPTSVQTISLEKRDRLLTLPRMQRADPPTYLVRSTSGDYLRGKLLSMDATVVRMSVQSKIKELPRSQVAKLIALQMAETAVFPSPTAGFKEMSSDLPGISVQGVTGSGFRLTLLADRIDGNVVFGRSGAIGKCRMDLSAVDELLIGNAIHGQSPRAFPYRQWLLTPAKDPKNAPPQRAVAAGHQAADGVKAREGNAIAFNSNEILTDRERQWIGKKPPLASLVMPLLDARPNGNEGVSIVSHEGQIIVLEFWSAAVQPSVDALSKVAAVVGEYSDQGVMLLAVNLRSTVAQARQAIALRALSGQFAIALDPKAYWETNLNIGQMSLPYWIVVDRSGKIAAMLNAEGRPTAIDELRTTLGQLVERSVDERLEFEQLKVARTAALAGDRGCLTPLGQLLSSSTPLVRQRSIELLRQLTGIMSDELPYSNSDPDQKRIENAVGWRQWIAQSGITARITFPKSAVLVGQMGRTLLCGSKDVVEVDVHGVETFRVPFTGAWACQGLPNGHRLVGSHAERFLVEYDEFGDEVWRVSNMPGGPMSVQRLDDGNTLVSLSDANRVVEYSPDGTILWDVTLPGRPCDARRIDNGLTLVAMHKAGRIAEIDRNGKEVWAVEALQDPQTAQRLPSGNTLVLLTTPGIVQEIDRSGNVVWSKGDFAIPVDAQRLLDGNTLVQQQDGALILLDKSGAQISRDITRGSGSRFHRY